MIAMTRTVGDPTVTCELVRMGGSLMSASHSGRCRVVVAKDVHVVVEVVRQRDTALLGAGDVVGHEPLEGTFFVHDDRSVARG